MAKIIFIPRLRTDEGFDKLEKDALTWPGTTVKAYGDAPCFTAEHFSSPANEIIVMGGHCSAGQAYVGWPGNHQNPVEYGEVVDRLLASGMYGHKDFAGHIKIYSCQSAEVERHPNADPISRDISILGLSFASAIQRLLLGRGYESCTVWGYTGNISTALVTRFGKTVGADLALRATDPRKARPGGAMFSKTASEAEVRVNLS